MSDVKKTKEQLIHELSMLRKQLRKYEKEVDLNREKLQQADYYRAIFEYSLNGIVIIDFDGNIIDANDIILGIMGYNHDEIIKLNISSFLPPEQYEIAAKEIDYIKRTGKQKEIIVLKPRKKDGTSIWFEINGFLLYRNKKPFAIQCISRDITEHKRVEVALRKREERYRSIVDNINELLFTVDESGTILFINAPVVKFTGYDQRYCIGRSFEEFIYKDDRLIFFENISQLLEQKDNDDIENIYHDFKIRMIIKEDENIWVNVQLRPFVDYQDRIIGFTGIAHDITIRKKAEDALKESKEKYRMLAENASDVIWTSDLKLKLTYLSPSVFNLTGYIPEESLQHTPDMIMTPDSIVRAAKALEHQLGQEENLPLLERNQEVTIEIDFFHKDGSTVSAEVRVSGLRDENNKLIGLLGMSRDITNRKLTEKRLLESETRYRELYRKSKQREHLYESLLNSTPDAVVIYNPNGRVIYVNPEFTRVFGYDLDEIAGKSLPYVPKDDKDRTEVMETMVLAEKPVTGLETERLTKDGRIIDVIISSSCYTDHEGAPAGYLVVLRDITETRFIERQLRQSQRMEAIGTLAGGIAHDFNNLLQGIQGYTQLLLLSKQEDDAGYVELREIERAILRASSLTQQLLTFSRKLESNFQAVDINHEIRQVRGLLERTISKMISVELDLSSDQLVVNADPAQVEQILMNLVINARDSMPEGGRLIIETAESVVDEEYCSVHVGAQPGHYVLIIVSDTGHGMDKETVDRIFEPFFTTKGIGKGTGLGLSTVYGIVKNHGGYIMCYSEQELGTTFKVYLPLIKKSPVTESLRDVVTPVGGPETILLVDDEDAIRDVGERILSRFGYTVFTACNGMSALELYKNTPGDIDLVILDLMMPEMGGKRCLKEILALDRDARVIISSGYSESGTTEEILNDGACGFIRKPYELKKILKIVREVLDT